MSALVVARVSAAGSGGGTGTMAPPPVSGSGSGDADDPDAHARAFFSAAIASLSRGESIDAALRLFLEQHSRPKTQAMVVYQADGGPASKRVAIAADSGSGGRSLAMISRVPELPGPGKVAVRKMPLALSELQPPAEPVHLSDNPLSLIVPPTRCSFSGRPNHDGPAEFFADLEQRGALAVPTDAGAVAVVSAPSALAGAEAEHTAPTANAAAAVVPVTQSTAATIRNWAVALLRGPVTAAVRTHTDAQPNVNGVSLRQLCTAPSAGRRPMPEDVKDLNRIFSDRTWAERTFGPRTDLDRLQVRPATPRRHHLLYLTPPIAALGERPCSRGRNCEGLKIGTDPFSGGRSGGGMILREYLPVAAHVEFMEHGPSVLPAVRGYCVLCYTAFVPEIGVENQRMENRVDTSGLAGLASNIETVIVGEGEYAPSAILQQPAGGQFGLEGDVLAHSRSNYHVVETGGIALRNLPDQLPPETDDRRICQIGMDFRLPSVATLALPPRREI